MECYDHSGKVNRVHPKQINGQNVLSPHYPPLLESYFMNKQEIGKLLKLELKKNMTLLPFLVGLIKSTLIIYEL